MIDQIYNMITSYVFNMSVLITHTDNSVSELIISRDALGSVYINHPDQYASIMEEINEFTDCFSTFPIANIDFVFTGNIVTSSPASPNPPPADRLSTNPIVPINGGSINGLIFVMSTTFTSNGSTYSSTIQYGSDWVVYGDSEAFDLLFLEKIEDLNELFGIAGISLFPEDSSIIYTSRYMFDDNIGEYPSGSTLYPRDSSGNDLSGNDFNNVGNFGFLTKEENGSMVLAQDSSIWFPSLDVVVPGLQSANGIRFRLKNLNVAGAVNRSGINAINALFHDNPNRDNENYLFSFYSFVNDDQSEFNIYTYDWNGDEVISDLNVYVDSLNIALVVVDYSFITGDISISINDTVVAQGSGIPIDISIHNHISFLLQGSGNGGKIDEISTELY